MDLTNPPTEAEVSDIIWLLNTEVHADHAGVVRRLAFQRDRLHTEVCRLRQVLSELVRILKKENDERKPF